MHNNTNTIKAGLATTIAREFFSRYQQQDVPAMIALFASGGVVEYVPLQLEGPVRPAHWVFLACLDQAAYSARS
jgi:hypothetical protein